MLSEISPKLKGIFHKLFLHSMLGHGSPFIVAVLNKNKNRGRGHLVLILDKKIWLASLVLPYGQMIFAHDFDEFLSFSIKIPSFSRENFNFVI